MCRHRHVDTVEVRAASRLWLILFIGIALVAASATARAAEQTLQNINVQALPGDGARITLKLSGPAPEPRTFTVENPATLSLDLPNTANGLTQRYRDLNVGAARTLAAVESRGRTRVVVGLSSLVAYDVQTRGNRIVITLNGTGAPAARTPTQAASGDTRITGLEFRRGEAGAGRVIVALAGPNAAANVRESAGNVIVDFQQTNVSDRLIRRVDVLDFATPVKYIEMRRSEDGVRMTVIPREGSTFERVAYQTDDRFTLELQPVEAVDANPLGARERTYTGKRISLNFQDIGVRAVLQILAEVGEVNMVISDSVSGTMALRLQNVPWDQALDIILTTQSLGKTRTGDVILVAPLQEIAARQAAEYQAYTASKELAPLRTEIIQVNYAKGGELAALLESEGNSFLSERGTVSVDVRTNTLIVQDTAAKLTDVRALVDRLDIPVQQVLIEARIVIANNDFARDLGARFGVTYVNETGEGLVTTSGSADATDNIVNDFLEDGLPVGLPDVNNRFNVALPAAAASPAGIAFGILGSDYLIDLELSALQAEGRGEVVSSPRVITANAQEAVIEQGVEIPYQEAASSGATSVSFKEAVLSLQVTPQITPDGRIIMDLSVTKDNIGQIIPTAGGGSVPSINTRSVTTQVLVNNGETVVLGGIYEQEKNSTVSKVPLLGDIPLIGALFRSTSTETSKRELLIFVTPKILSQDLNINN